MSMRPLLAATVLLATTPVAWAEGFPVVVTHALGETTVETQPQRVVSLGLNDHDFLYQLGIAPVGVHEWWGEQPFATWPWAEEARLATGAEPAVLQGSEVDMEWVVAQNPDLIVATYFDLDASTYDLLSQIAPVIAHPEGFGGYEAPWQEQLDLLDLATSGSTTKAEAIIGQLDETIADIRSEFPQFAGHTASMADLRDGQFTLWAREHAPTRFLESLGFTFPEELDAMADEAGWIYLSQELADRLDLLDTVVWPNGKRDEIEAISTYNVLRLNREKRSVFPAPGEETLAAALWFQTPLSIAYAAKAFAPKLAAALDASD
jgi:iron complex transport system substrate-binding protein